MSRQKRHLSARRGRGHTACGLAWAGWVTDRPERVTCGRCLRTERMAIVELRAREERVADFKRRIRKQQRPT